MELQTNRSYLKKIALGVGLLAILGAGFAFYHYQSQHEIVQDFNESRDTQFILDAFKRDWYWLVEGFDFSPEYMLKYRAIKSRPDLKKKVTIKVAYQDKKPVGFIVYWPKSFYLGFINFVDIEPEFRSKGWAYKLFDYAVKDLIKNGITRIELLTRATNYSAQKLYIRYGFKETRRDDGFVYYDYVVPNK